MVHRLKQTIWEFYFICFFLVMETTTMMTVRSNNKEHNKINVKYLYELIDTKVSIKIETELKKRTKIRKVFAFALAHIPIFFFLSSSILHFQPFWLFSYIFFFFFWQMFHEILRNALELVWAIIIHRSAIIIVYRWYFFFFFFSFWAS